MSGSVADDFVAAEGAPLGAAEAAPLAAAEAAPLDDDLPERMNMSLKEALNIIGGKDEDFDSWLTMFTALSPADRKRVVEHETAAPILLHPARRLASGERMANAYGHAGYFRFVRKLVEMGYPVPQPGRKYVQWAVADRLHDPEFDENAMWFLVRMMLSRMATTSSAISDTKTLMQGLYVREPDPIPSDLTPLHVYQAITKHRLPQKWHLVFEDHPLSTQQMGSFCALAQCGAEARSYFAARMGVAPDAKDEREAAEAAVARAASLEAAKEAAAKAEIEAAKADARAGVLLQEAARLSAKAKRLTSEARGLHTSADKLRKDAAAAVAKSAEIKPTETQIREAKACETLDNLKQQLEFLQYGGFLFPSALQVKLVGSLAVDRDL